MGSVPPHPGAMEQSSRPSTPLLLLHCRLTPTHLLGAMFDLFFVCFPVPLSEQVHVSIFKQRQVGALLRTRLWESGNISFDLTETAREC